MESAAVFNDDDLIVPNGVQIPPSDEIRKRLGGVSPLQRLGPDGYSQQMSERVYATAVNHARAAIREGHSAIVDAVVKLAQALGLKVVAEGVETEAQHQILRSFGCHELQGFFFARPMSARALSTWAIEDLGPRALEFRDSMYHTTIAGSLH